MKTIKKGRKQKGWAKEYTCTGAGNGNGGCSAVLLVEEADFFKTSRSFYDGSTDYFVTFECQECGVWTDVKDFGGVYSNLGHRAPSSRYRADD